MQSEHEYALALGDAGAAQLSVAGGKGASLARAAGLPVRRSRRFLSADHGAAGGQRGPGDRTVPAGPRQTGTRAA
jgi:hypothetical protein